MKKSPLAKRKNGIIIAIDGPAGVGKSTVGKMVASKLGYKFVNTGEMYRALAWKAIELGIDPSDEKGVSALVRKIRWGFKAAKNGVIKTLVNGVLMDGRIFSEAVSIGSSTVAKNPEVRPFMKRMQVKLGQDGGIVMEGRDISTAIFPDAELKLFLDANAKCRAKRRYGELTGKNIKADYGKILKGIKERDKADRGRKLAPLSKAPGAAVIDTSNMSVGGVVSEIISLVKQRCYMIC
ncbi:MAG: (d)CMP kinase [Elusimicrobia bacterium]|nr:(d)CMP kinase [Elusimicrobiota bacterium]